MVLIHCPLKFSHLRLVVCRQTSGRDRRKSTAATVSGCPVVGMAYGHGASMRPSHWPLSRGHAHWCPNVFRGAENQSLAVRTSLQQWSAATHCRTRSVGQRSNRNQVSESTINQCVARPSGLLSAYCLSESSTCSCVTIHVKLINL